MSTIDPSTEERLVRALRAVSATVPDHPDGPWRPVARHRVLHHRAYAVIGVAASVVVLVLATLLWAAPSAGARATGGIRRAPQACVTLAGRCVLTQSGVPLAAMFGATTVHTHIPSTTRVAPSAEEEDRSDV